MFKSVEVTLFVILTLFVLLMIVGITHKFEKENEYVTACKAKGGEAIHTKSGMICFNKEALIKERK